MILILCLNIINFDIFFPKLDKVVA
ncbi:hypothetical protein PanWU01x14_352860 [Parasponia andersonii]|uniref:Uncharacterized protein n=1 Tax=Parasponia andersonii TaxID=3476 RepID=A0A2P5AA72_PARAD|nr:hypothetical protein PanWU01x14_352860 [Parasponia andersonii]